MTAEDWSYVLQRIPGVIVAQRLDPEVAGEAVFD
jgi:hypothetical protein